MGRERISLEAVYAVTSRCEADENMVEELIRIRPVRTDLTDEEYIAQAGMLIVRNRITTPLQDALGFYGEKHLSDLFPLMNTIDSIGSAIVNDIVSLQKGIEGNIDER